MRYEVKIASLFAVMAILLGCSSQRPPSPKQPSSTPVSLSSSTAEAPILCDRKPFTQQELDQAALNVLWPKLEWLNTADPTITYEKIARSRKKTAVVRAWVFTLPSDRVRDAYVHWLDGFDRDALEAEGKLKHPDNSAARIEQEDQQKKARIRELEGCLPRPKI